jgi:hypothetical protein
MVDKKASGTAVAKTQAEADAIARSIVADLMSDLGLSLPQALGVVGNLGYESKSPTSTVPFSAYQEADFNKHGTKGVGWAQWTGYRRGTFEDWAKLNNLPPNSYAANIGYLKTELAGKIPGLNKSQYGALDKIRATSTPREAFDIFMRDFENPFSKAYVGERLENRLSIMNSFAEPIIKEVQQSLANLGYDVAVDGAWGPQTANALAGYQIANFPGEGQPGAKALSSLAPSVRESVRTMENRSMVDLLDYQDNRSIRQQELDSMRRMNIMNQEKQAFNQRLTENLGQYQPGRGGTPRGRFDMPIGRLPADPKQPAMPGGPIGRLPADPNRPAMPGGPTPGQIPAERLARSPITGQRARLSEIASMQALQNYRNEPRIVASPPFSGVGRMPAPGEGERLARSAIMGQQARASEIKSLSDLAAMTRATNEQRAGLASMGRASENRSMADLASMDRKVAENRAVYAPFARAAENKSMADLAAMNRSNAMGQASQARASENASMAALGQMRAPTITGRPDAPMGFVSRVEGRPQGAIGSLPISPTVGATNFGPGPTDTREASRWNATTGLITRADQQIADLQRGPSKSPTSDFRQTPASRLAEAYGVMGRSRVEAAIPSARLDPRAAAATQGFVSGWGGKPQTGSTMPMDAVMAPRQIQTAPAAVPAVPPAAPAPISTASSQGSRLAAGDAGYAAARGYPMGATLQPAPQPAAPLQQRAAPAPVVTQPQRQITNEPQFSGRTPGDRARSAAFQPGGIFGYTSQQARGGGGYNPTPV